jgi:hypothetical protein
LFYCLCEKDIIWKRWKPARTYAPTQCMKLKCDLLWAWVDGCADSSP